METPQCDVTAKPATVPSTPTPHTTPLLYIVLLPMALGIVIGEYSGTPISTTALYIALATTLALSIAVFALRRHHSNDPFRGIAFATSLMLFFATAGLALHRANTPHYQLPEGSQTARLLIVENLHPSRSHHRAIATISAIQSDTAWLPARGRVMLYVRLADSTTYDEGTILESHLFIIRPQRRDSTSFDFPRYLRHRHIAYTAYTGSHNPTAIGHAPLTVSQQARRLQLSLAQKLHSPHLSPQHTSFASALLLGLRDDDFPSLRQHYLAAGIVHLLCVSGLHVGLVAAFVLLLFRPFGNRRPLRIARSLTTIGALWLFALITGLAPATVRAAFMLTLFLTATLLRRHPSHLATLTLTALVMLIADPFLLFSVSFQLSFAAMAGLTLLFFPLRHLLPPPAYTSPRSLLPILGHDLLMLAILSLSAQMAVLPLQLFYFHQLQPYALLANVLIVPFAGVLLFAALLVVLLAFWPWAHALAATALDLMLSALDGIVLRISSLHGATVAIDHFSLPMVILAYLALLLLARLIAMLSQKQQRHPQGYNQMSLPNKQ